MQLHRLSLLLLSISAAGCAVSAEPEDPEASSDELRRLRASEIAGNLRCGDTKEVVMPLGSLDHKAFRFRVPAGTTVTVTAESHTLRPGLHLVNGQGTELAAPQVRPTQRPAHVIETLITSNANRYAVIEDPTIPGPLARPYWATVSLDCRSPNPPVQPPASEWFDSVADCEGPALTPAEAEAFLGPAQFRRVTLPERVVARSRRCSSAGACDPWLEVGDLVDGTARRGATRTDRGGYHTRRFDARLVLERMSPTSVVAVIEDKSIVRYASALHDEGLLFDLQTETLASRGSATNLELAYDPDEYTGRTVYSTDLGRLSDATMKVTPTCAVLRGTKFVTRATFAGPRTTEVQYAVRFRYELQ